MKGREEKLKIPPPSASPWLVYTHGDYRSKNIQTFCSITSSHHTKSYIKSIPDLRGKRIYTSSNGWLILADIYKHTNQCYLWDPVTSHLIKLPPLPRSLTLWFSAIVINNTNNNIRPYMVLFLRGNALLSCGVNEDEHDDDTCLLYETYSLDVSLQAIVLAAIITDNNVIYALVSKEDFNEDTKELEDRDYLATLELHEDNNSGVSITLGSLLVCFSTILDSWNYFFESCGDIYIANMLRNERGQMDDLKIIQLNFETLTWEYVRSIGDRAFFIDHEHGYCTWCWANKEAGVEPNSVYILYYNKYKEQKDTVLLYKLDDHSLTLLRSTPHLVSPSTIPSFV